MRRFFFALVVFTCFSVVAETTNITTAVGLPIPLGLLNPPADPNHSSGGTGTTNDLTQSTVVISNVPPDQLILDVNVRVNLQHTYDQDLILRLLGPNGAVVVLAANLGGAADNYTQTEFDDQASQSITTNSPPFTGTFKPQQPLSVLNGQAVNGTWTLQVEDTSQGDQGTFVDWTLSVTYGVFVGEPPTLSIGKTNDTSVIISWPDTAAGFVLHAKNDLNQTNWTNAGVSPTQANGQFTAVVPTTGPMRFFRLIR